jgi:hypothetical protein
MARSVGLISVDFGRLPPGYTNLLHSHEKIWLSTLEHGLRVLVSSLARSGTYREPRAAHPVRLTPQPPLLRKQPAFANGHESAIKTLYVCFALLSSPCIYSIPFYVFFFLLLCFFMSLLEGKGAVLLTLC